MPLSLPLAWTRRLGRHVRRVLWDGLPLRQKLALGVWLSVVPLSLGASLLALNQTRHLAERRVRQQLQADATEARNWFAEWSANHQRMLQWVAGLPALKTLNQRQAAAELVRAHQQFPDYTYALSLPNGERLVLAGPIRPNPGLNRTERLALKGRGSNHLGTPPPPAEPYFSSSVPVYAGTAPHQGPPIAVLSTYAPLAAVNRIMGINSLMQANRNISSFIPELDLAAGEARGYAFLQVLAGGQVLLGKGAPVVLAEQHHHHHRGDPRYNASGNAWKPFLNLATQSNQHQQFSLVQVQGRSYYVAIDRLNSENISLVIIDQETALTNITQLFKGIWLGNILGLSLSLAAIYRICQTLAKPIDQVRQSLTRLSQGEFGYPLPTVPGDIGELFACVNQASEQLQAYLADARAHAVTDAQLQEARRIQADFLIRHLPSTEQVELAASFTPAYEIGADWYDALLIDGITVVIVADVCDKGVPSALYMSVFRSLLRLSLLKTWPLADSPAQAIAQALDAVNTYMAETHGNTNMFATGFVGAYDPQQRTLSYVVAGHELPWVYYDGAVTALELGGPALGLFTEAQFRVLTCPLPAGAVLLAYTDGLPDARNPANASFGKERVPELLHQLAATDPSAQELLRGVQQAALAHMDGAEQFDDLTLLVLKAREGA